MSDLREFRHDTRDWLERMCPAEMRTPIETNAEVCWGGRDFPFASAIQRTWLDRMASVGWTVPEWPVEFGGGGLTSEQALVLREEMSRIGAREPLYGVGIIMLGPALLRFGTPAQKAKYLPSIARGEIRWCQGYSEPNAGSDLASLRTKARHQGEHFVVTGQKVWTSYAHLSDWMFCLVRTNEEAPKHRGITFLMFDMQSAGVSTRPIELISGRSHFCETFLDEVAVPADQVVGDVDGGWDVAKYLLMHERATVGAGVSTRGSLRVKTLSQAIRDAAPTALAQPGLRLAVAAQEMETLAIQHTRRRYADEADNGQAQPARASLTKLLGTETRKRDHDLLMEAVGLNATRERWGTDDWTSDWLRSRGNSIEGGTSEIMLKIVARSLLGLPDA